MSASLCQKVESAIVRWLVQRAGSDDAVASSFGLAKTATGCSVTNVGRYTKADYGSFSLNFYCGESEEAVQLPAVVVACVDAREDEYQRNLFLCDVQIDVEVSADSETSEGVTVVDSVEWLEGISVWLAELLQTTRIQDEIETAETDFICNGRTQISSQRVSEGRRRIHRATFSLSCSYGS